MVASSQPPQAGQRSARASAPVLPRASGAGIEGSVSVAVGTHRQGGRSVPAPVAPPHVPQGGADVSSLLGCLIVLGPIVSRED